tara:strand:+ start:1161 stop:2351 length:1191 start_codon:yes stop_codon:yes gene_type:complete
MNYHSLNDFVDLLARGEVEVHGPVRLPNVKHNTIHNVPFLDHCDHLCKKHDTNMLKLLSVIQQKLNNDMILRLKQSPVFSNKLKGVAKEWGEDIDPYDLFRCPDECYDSTHYNRISELVRSNDDDYSRLDDVDGENTDSGIYEMMERLKGNYYSYGEEIQGNLSEIGQRRNEYNPQYRDILCDLSTKHKSYYLDDLLMDNNDNGNLTNGVNRRINKRIPENIHVIFLNNLLIPNLMSKCMEKHRHDFMEMKDSLENKQNRLNDVMVRIGPSEPLSDSIVNLLQGFKNYFEENEDNLPSDDEEPSDQIKVALDTLINRSNELSENEEGSDYESDKEMYHLKMPDHAHIDMDPVDSVTHIDMEDDMSDMSATSAVSAKKLRLQKMLGQNVIKEPLTFY